jgi:hypothetical protein
VCIRFWVSPRYAWFTALRVDSMPSLAG